MFLNSALFKYHKKPLLFIILSSILYLTFAYDLVRTDVTKLLLLYIALFVFAYQLKKSAGFNFSILAISAVVFRLLFINAIPNLSQDFYRFIWDGRMIFEGYNPYLYTPDAFINNGQFPVHEAQELYNGMGSLSSGHFTNYPPLNQLCFFIAALFGGKSILSGAIVIRVIIIAADIGTLYFGKKLLERLRLPSSRIWWYILNPFIIIELTGNLHFEGVMVFFLVWSFYLLHKGYFKWAAVVLACSISVKLIPLMFLPIFFWWFIKKDGKSWTSKFSDLKKLILFYSIVGGTILILFLPFFSMEFINNYSKTVGLWFNNFEFNGSIYYLARAIGYRITGYNEIAIIGKILPVISLLCILGISFFRKNSHFGTFCASIVLAFSLYLFLSTTVHPWYIATLLIVSLFTNYRFPLVWSLAIILSYLAYSNTSNSENLWVIALEYGIVFIAFTWEILLKKRIKV